MLKNWSISSQLILEEAGRLWFKVEKIVENKNLFTVTWNNRTYIFKNIECWLNTALWNRLSQDKELTYTILPNNIVPNSVYLSKDNNYDISNIWINYPLVVKPTDTDHGDWVSVSITNMQELQNAIDFAFSFSDKIIIQNFVNGYDYRVLVVWDKVCAVAKRIPPFVIWDWVSSIKELIEKENTNPLRSKKNHIGPMSIIKIDNELEKTLSSHDKTLNSVLSIWEKFVLRKNANLSTWWLSIDVTDIIHEENKKIAISVAKKLWLSVAWVDIVCEDISKPITKYWWFIIEINATPWLRMHYYPSEWKPRNVALDILKLRFEL